MPTLSQLFAWLSDRYRVGAVIATPTGQFLTH